MTEIVVTSTYGIGATLCPVCGAAFPWVGAERDGRLTSGATQADILVARHMELAHG